MGGNNRIAVGIDGYFYAVLFTVVIFAAFINTAIFIKYDFSAKFHRVDLCETEIFSNSVRAHFGGVELADILQQIVILQNNQILSEIFF